MRCPVCNSELEEGSRYCGVCGAAVTSGTGAQTGSFCGHCGAAIPAGAGVCPMCGTPADPNAGNGIYTDGYYGGSYPYGEKTRKNGLPKSVIAVIAAAAAAVAAAAVFGFIWLSRDSDSGGDTGRTAAAETERAAAPTETAETSTVPPSYTYAPSASGGYIFPSDSRYITQADLDSRSRDEVRMILNEMYAKHGYIFSLEQYRQYFEAQPWYRGTTTNQDVAAASFNQYETANKDFIIKYEEAHGWR